MPVHMLVTSLSSFPSFTNQSSFYYSQPTLKWVSQKRLGSLFQTYRKAFQCPQWLIASSTIPSCADKKPPQNDRVRQLTYEENIVRCPAHFYIGREMPNSTEQEPHYSELPSNSVDISNSKTMWAKLGQRFNSAGIISTLRVMFKEQHLALPHLTVPDIRWINWKELRKQGFQGIVFDKDNTLTAPYAPSLWPTLADSLEVCKSVFEGRIALLSNSAGLYQYDADGSEAKALENLIGIPVIRHGTKKPAGTAKEIQNYFGYDPSLLVMVGDRHFTDIVYGNRNGFLTILTEPLTLAGEPFIVRQIRKLESSLVQCWSRKGLTPTSHSLLLGKHEYIKDPGF